MLHISAKMFLVHSPTLKAARELSECEKFMLIKEHSWQLLKNDFFQKLKQNGFSSTILPQLTIMCDSYSCQKIFSHQTEKGIEDLPFFPLFSVYSYERKMIYDYYNYISP